MLPKLTNGSNAVLITAFFLFLLGPAQLVIRKSEVKVKRI